MKHGKHGEKKKSAVKSMLKELISEMDGLLSESVKDKLPKKKKVMATVSAPVDKIEEAAKKAKELAPISEQIMKDYLGKDSKKEKKA